MKLFQLIKAEQVEILKSSGTVFALKTLGAVVNFGFSILLARILGIEDSGVYFLCFTLMTIGATIGRFGMDKVLLRYISAHAAASKWAETKDLLYKGFKIICMSSLLIMTLFLLFSSTLAINIFNKPEIVSPLRFMLLATLPFAVFFSCSEIFKAFKKFALSQILILIVPAIALLIFFLLTNQFQITGAVTAYLAAVIIAALAGYTLLQKEIPKKTKPRQSLLLRDLLNRGFPLMLVALMNILMNWSSNIVLGIWGTKSELGLFSVCLRTAMLTSFVLMAVNSVIAPRFAHLYNEQRHKELAVLVRSSVKIMLSFAAPILLIFLFFPGSILAVFGPDFISGAPLLIILAAGQFINVSTGSIGFLLMMTGHEKQLRNATFFAGLIAIILNIALVPQIGVLGAAIATALSVASLNLLASFWVWKFLRIWTVPFLKKPPGYI